MVKCLHCGEEIYDPFRMDPPIHHSCLGKHLNELKSRVDGLEATSMLYHELLYQVVNKHPNESRHETAKRIIHQHENQNNSPEAASRSKHHE